MDLDNFVTWLRDNTDLSESSIQLYGRTIKSYLNEYPEISIENLNKYITHSFRDSSSLYVKYALKHYLNFIGKSYLYSQLVNVKLKPRKKLGIYLPKDHIIKIIKNITREEFLDIAWLQYATAARAREIITLKEENIDLNCHRILHV